MKQKAILALFTALAIIWGTSFTAIEIGLEELPPILFAALRFDIAALVFLSAVIVTKAQLIPRTHGDIKYILATGVFVIGGHYAFLFTGQTYVTSSITAIIMSTTPILTPLIAVKLIPTQGISATDVTGLLTGLVGVVFIAMQGGALNGSLIGIGLLLASATIFALGSVLTERTEETMPLISLQAWATGIGAVLLHTTSYAYAGEPITSITWTLDAVAALVYLAVIATVGAFLIYFTLLRVVGASELSLIGYASPVVTAIFGVILLGETITLFTVVGFALIITGFAFCEIKQINAVIQSMRSDTHTEPIGKNETRINGDVYYTGSLSDDTHQPGD